MIPKPDNRYAMRSNDDCSQFWTVFDISTGEPVEVNGVLLDRCDIEEADDLVELLNVQYINRRRGRPH